MINTELHYPHHFRYLTEHTWLNFLKEIDKELQFIGGG